MSAELCFSMKVFPTTVKERCHIILKGLEELMFRW